MPTEADTVAAVLAAAAARHFGGPASIEKLARESGGASRQTWSFDAVVNGAAPRPHPAPRSADTGRGPPAGTRQGRQRALDRARPRHRVPRPAPPPTRPACARPSRCSSSRPSDGLGEAYVMRRIGGTAIARKLLRDPPYAKARGLIAGQLGEILARIHATDARHAAAAGAPRSRRPHRRPAPPARPAGPAAAGVRAGAVLARPAQARADRQAPVLVHGDYRTGNYLADETGVTAILDWEGAHLGDPDRGSGLAVRQELALRRGRQAGRRLRQPRGIVGRLRARRRRQGRSGARPLVGSLRHGALGHHLPQPGLAGISRARSNRWSSPRSAAAPSRPRSICCNC